MNVELSYGEATLTATLPARTRSLSNTEAVTTPPVAELEAEVAEALDRPVGLPRLGDLVTPGAAVTIAFDDATVGSFGPIRSVAIAAVLRELEAAGVSRRRVTLICANALHRKLRPAELARLIAVGRLAALGGEEALEEEPHPHRVDGGDPEHVADRRVGGAAAPLAEDALRAGEAGVSRPPRR